MTVCVRLCVGVWRSEAGGLVEKGKKEGWRGRRREGERVDDEEKEEEEEERGAVQ